MYKRLVLAAVSIVALCSLLFPASVSAFSAYGDLCSTDGAHGSTVCEQTGDNPFEGKEGLLPRIVKLIGTIAGIIAVIIVIYGGLQYILAGGDAGATKTARNTILYALIGLIVIIAAEFIVRFIISKF